MRAALTGTRALECCSRFHTPKTPACPSQVAVCLQACNMAVHKEMTWWYMQHALVVGMEKWT